MNNASKLQKLFMAMGAVIVSHLKALEAKVGDELSTDLNAEVPSLVKDLSNTAVAGVEDLASSAGVGNPLIQFAITAVEGFVTTNLPALEKALESEVSTEIVKVEDFIKSFL